MRKARLALTLILRTLRRLRTSTGIKVFDESGQCIYEGVSTGSQARSIHALPDEKSKASAMLELVYKTDKSGILPSVSTAQMILESGYCGTDLAVNANNCFGMKAERSSNTWKSVWDGKSTYTKRTEEQDRYGRPYYITAAFRKYPCVEVSYQVPVMKVKTYTIEEIFEKNLLFLIPFYIFTYESRFKEIEKDSDKLTEIISEYGMISDRLEECLSSGFIDEFTKKTIMDMSERVLENIARSYENIRKGVGTIMGGKILDYEAKRIRNEGINEGRSEGIIIGTVDTLRDIGLDDRSIIDKIREKYNLSQKEAEGYVLTSAVM
jgi:hypothetical protein